MIRLNRHLGVGRLLLLFHQSYVVPHYCQNVYSSCRWCKRRRSRFRVEQDERARSLVTTCRMWVVLVVFWVGGLPLSARSMMKLLRNSRWYVPVRAVERSPD